MRKDGGAGGGGGFSTKKARQIQLDDGINVTALCVDLQVDTGIHGTYTIVIYAYYNVAENFYLCRFDLVFLV